MRTPHTCKFAVAMGLLGCAAFAGDFNQKTIVTFSAPVEVPGKSLPAGTYVFKLIDSSTTNNVVQVFDQSERHLFTTFLAIPDHKMPQSSETVVMFEERPSDTPEAVRAIFCKGDNYAREFVYPHERALAISQRTHQTVLEMRDSNDNSPSSLKKAKVDSVEPGK